MKLKMPNLTKPLSINTLKNMFSKGSINSTGLIKGAFLGALALVSSGQANENDKNFPYNNVEKVESGNQMLVKTVTSENISLVGSVDGKEVLKAETDGNVFSLNHSIKTLDGENKIQTHGVLVYNGIEVQNVNIDETNSYSKSFAYDKYRNITGFKDLTKGGEGKGFTATYNDDSMLLTRDWDDGRYIHMGYGKNGDVVFQETDKGDNIISTRGERVVDGKSYEVQETKYYEGGQLSAFKANVVNQDGSYTPITSIGFHDNGNTAWVQTFEDKDPEKYEMVTFFNDGKTVSGIGKYKENGNYLYKKYTEEGGLLSAIETSRDGEVVFDFEADIENGATDVAIAEQDDVLYFYGDEKNIKVTGTNFDRDLNLILITQEYSSFNPSTQKKDTFEKTTTYSADNMSAPLEVSIGIEDIANRQVLPLVSYAYTGDMDNTLESIAIYPRSSMVQENNKDEIWFTPNGKISMMIKNSEDGKKNIQEYKDGNLVSNFLGKNGEVIQDINVVSGTLAYVNNDGMAECIIDDNKNRHDSCMYSPERNTATMFDMPSSTTTITLDRTYGDKLKQIDELIEKAPLEKRNELIELVLEHPEDLDLAKESVSDLVSEYMKDGQENTNTNKSKSKKSNTMKMG